MPTGQTIRTVVLDLDDTLIVEEATARRSLRAAADQVRGLDPDRLEAAVLGEARRRWRTGPHHPLCRELGFASWEGLWSTFEGGHPRLDGLRHWAPAYRAATWQTALAELEVRDERAPNACAAAFVVHQRRGHPLIEGAATCVSALGARHRLALLTNGPPDIQRHKIAATGLARCFDLTIVSGEVGLGKPDPEVFRLLLDRLGESPAQTLMVGDSWERDVRGALAAGMPAVWVSAGRPASTEVPDGVTVIESIADLEARLAGPGAGLPGDQPKVKS